MSNVKNTCSEENGCPATEKNEFLPKNTSMHYHDPILSFPENLKEIRQKL